MKEKILYSWKTDEFEHYEKSPAWYVNVGLLFLAITGLFIFWLHSYLAATVVILSLVALYTHANAQPRKITCKITNKRIKLGNRTYSFKELRSFWVHKYGLHPKLYFQTTSLLFSVISIPTGQGDTKRIRESLKNLLPEASRGEAVNDRLARWFRY